MSAACPICGGSGAEVVYEGPIRTGRFGSVSPEPHRVLRCGACGVARLEDPAALDYESSEYRTLVDGGEDSAHYYGLHDAEQPAKLALIQPSALRDKVVADIGCGAGSFLDFVRGLASRTLAIEPTRSFHETLRARGHEVVSWSRDAAPEWGGTVDQAFCFSVIEHVDDPLELLRDIRALLRPGGELLLSTPNAADWLLELLPDAYAPFFYRIVHRWYFDAESIRSLAERAGFSAVDVRFVHRFDVSNLLLWLRDRRPSGLGKVAVSPVVDAAFARWLEESGRADYIYARLIA